MGWFKELCLGYLVGSELENGNMEAAKEYLDELEKARLENKENDKKND